MPARCKWSRTFTQSALVRTSTANCPQLSRLARRSRRKAVTAASSAASSAHSRHSGSGPWRPTLCGGTSGMPSSSAVCSVNPEPAKLAAVCRISAVLR
ncbi:hypothetical protein D3C85_1556550 [compost metagenome]